jgi:hypothetical protein
MFSKGSIMRVLYAIIWLGLFYATAYAAESNHNAFENKEVGVYIEKPSGWHFISKQSAIDNRSNVRLKDEDFQRKYVDSATAPLVAINKYEDPASREGISPTVQVLITPSPSQNMTSEQALDMSIQVFKNNALSFNYNENISPLIISGLNGAKTVFTYSLDTNLGYKINVKTRTYVAKRGNYFIVLSMAGPTYGRDLSENEFQEIFKSLKIDK